MTHLTPENYLTTWVHHPTYGELRIRNIHRSAHSLWAVYHDPSPGKGGWRELKDVPGLEPRFRIEALLGHLNWMASVGKLTIGKEGTE
jgi:hypothetical protein